MFCTRSGHHRAPSPVPHLWLWRGLKPRSLFLCAGLRVQLGIRGDIFEGEPALLRAQSPVPRKAAATSAHLAAAHAQSHPSSPQPGLASG